MEVFFSVKFQKRTNLLVFTGETIFQIIFKQPKKLLELTDLKMIVFNVHISQDRAHMESSTCIIKPKIDQFSEYFD